MRSTRVCLETLKIIAGKREIVPRVFVFVFVLNNDENIQLCNSSQFTKSYHRHFYSHSHPVRYVAALSFRWGSWTLEKLTNSRSEPERVRARSPHPGCSGPNPQTPRCPRQSSPSGLATELDNTHEYRPCPSGVSQADFPLATQPITSACCPSLRCYDFIFAFQEHGTLSHFLTPFNWASKPHEFLEVPNNLWQVSERGNVKSHIPHVQFPRSVRVETDTQRDCGWVRNCG